MNCFVSSESLWISLFWGVFYPCLVSLCWCLYGLVLLGALGGGLREWGPLETRSPQAGRLRGVRCYWRGSGFTWPAIRLGSARKGRKRAIQCTKRGEIVKGWGWITLLEVSNGNPWCRKTRGCIDQLILG